MKKVLSVLMVVAAMMFATNANAQIKFGLKGGWIDISTGASCCFDHPVWMLLTCL